ncbi:MAG: flagellar biosynthesis anti-sigma factor FlgM [Vampirovibrionales bacterium]|nr:flagellar biosynthesis anti-sigma factor FlgM [Vampirovibrionales bacterium]
MTSINGIRNGYQADLTGILAQNAAADAAQSVDADKTSANAPHTNPLGQFEDEANISKAALAKLERFKAIRPFVQAAMAKPEATDPQTVSNLRGLIQSGQYKIDSSAVAKAMLAEPAGKFLAMAM